ncbi:hypothetical protein BgiMline_021847 [Biomphalaria glabrata]|nr:hypothetical protein BgiMline_028414 [Biomphalaria glabrata]
MSWKDDFILLCKRAVAEDDFIRLCKREVAEDDFILLCKRAVAEDDFILLCKRAVAEDDSNQIKTQNFVLHYKIHNTLLAQNTDVYTKLISVYIETNTCNVTATKSFAVCRRSRRAV